MLINNFQRHFPLEKKYIELSYQIKKLKRYFGIMIFGVVHYLYFLLKKNGIVLILTNIKTNINTKTMLTHFKIAALLFFD